MFEVNRLYCDLKNLLSLTNKYPYSPINNKLMPNPDH